MAIGKVYRIMYFCGDEISLSSKMITGKAIIEYGKLNLQGEVKLSLAIEELENIELYRLHGMGRMIRFRCSKKQYFLTVIRFNLFGYFAMINYFATGKLHQQLLSHAIGKST